MKVTPLPSEAPGPAFMNYLKAGELKVQVCGDTGRQIYYPRTICPGTAGSPEWRPTSGRGTVYSTTIVRQRPERGGDYNIAIVELDEGARVFTRVEGIPAAEVRIGMAVKAEISAAADGTPLLVFRAIEDKRA